MYTHTDPDSTGAALLVTGDRHVTVGVALVAAADLESYCRWCTVGIRTLGREYSVLRNDSFATVPVTTWTP